MLKVASTTMDAPIDTIPDADPEEVVDATVKRSQRRNCLSPMVLMARAVSVAELPMMVSRRRGQRCDFVCVRCCLM
jgi:hypothetical protein